MKRSGKKIRRFGCDDPNCPACTAMVLKPNLLAWMVMTPLREKPRGKRAKRAAGTQLKKAVRNFNV